MEPNEKITDTRQYLGKPLRRSFALVREALAVDEEARTVELAFASDAPIQHWFGTVILDHSTKAVMLDRLLSNGPLLENHDTDRQIGAVRGASTDGHVSRATVQFSKRQSAQDTFQDVQDGICRSVSVGFMIHELVLEESNDNEDIYRATKWEPFEISLVPVPADTSVGVGRSLDTEPEPGAATAAPSAPLPAAQPPATESGDTRRANSTITEKRNAMDEENVTTPELTRAQEIAGLGNLLGEVELAREFIADEKTPAEFKAAVKAKQTAARAQSQPTAEDPSAAAQRNGGGAVVVISRHAKVKSFKGEGAEERAHRFGMFMLAGPLGRAIDSPIIQRAREFCRNNGIALTRAHTESVNEDGGFNVPTEFGNDMIDLREEYGVFRPNTKVVPMTSDTKTQPRRTGGLTAYAVGETKAITESKKGWDRVSLVAKKWGVLAKYSTELSEDSVLSIGDDLFSEIGYAFAQKEDECGFNADGSSTYHGIVGVRAKLRTLHATIANIAGLSVASGNLFSEFTLADFLRVKGLLPAYVYKRTTPKWYCHQTFYTQVMEALSLAAGGVTAAEIIRGATSGLPTFLGQPVEITQAMPNTDANSQIPVLYGGLSLASMLGDRRDVALSMTDSNDTDFEQDLMSIKGTTRFDINVHDVGNASATANQRVPGPVVGLISAAS